MAEEIFCWFSDIPAVYRLIVKVHTRIQERHTELTDELQQAYKREKFCWNVWHGRNGLKDTVGERWEKYFLDHREQHNYSHKWFEGGRNELSNLATTPMLSF